MFKSTLREWFWAAVIAVGITIIIRTFLLEAYTIPTSSMEKTLLVGDYLFVNKFYYGVRLPITPVSLPFAHNSMPFGLGKSYWDGWQLPYYRLPARHRVKRHDAVVFNYPKDQTRPIDKRENYIKRCIALPADTFSIVDRKVYINGVEDTLPAFAQYNYYVRTNGTPIDNQTFLNLDITEGGLRAETGDLYEYALTNFDLEQVKQIANVSKIDTIVRDKETYLSHEPVFPQDPEYFPWNIDNYGPLVIPAKGMTVPLSIANLSLYSYLIEHYEGNEISLSGVEININGEIVDHYTFKQNYYFMLGDNRQNSSDSRFWGFVPEDHIVGKAFMVWLSMKPGTGFPDNLRWNRILKWVK